MRIFICWSGEQSKSIASAMDNWLPTILGKDTTFFSEKAIEKGTRWFEAVNVELNRATAGLVCVTLENVRSPWVHFEAGALAKAVNQRLFTYLYGVEPGDLTGPLSAYQYTRPTEEDTKRLIKSLSESLDPDTPLRTNWEASFHKQWPHLKQILDEMAPLPVEKILPELEGYFQRKTFNEPIQDCANQSWIARYMGAVQTLERLRDDRALLVNHGASYALDLFDQLIAETDGYAMVMQACLLEEKKFPGLLRGGALDLPDGVRDACERRRLRVKSLVSRLLAPGGAPIFENSRRFAKMTTLEEKKNLLIHPAGQAIRRRDKPYSPERVRQAEGSQWEFDRIVYYLAQERWEDLDRKPLVRCVNAELEKLRSRFEPRSFAPLYYSLRAVRELAGQRNRDIIEEAPRIRQTLDDVDKYVHDALIQDTTLEIRRALETPVRNTAAAQ